jgi:cell division protein FtsZ
VSINGAKGVLFAIAGGDDLGMLEIQDAARIITESIDPHAKVIFGAIKDDKLKKNEVRVTVIATGFPDPETGHHVSPQPTRIFERVDRTEDKEPTRGRIFNSISPRPTDEPVARETTSTAPPEVQPKEPKPVDPVDEEESDDDWGAVPAFLRRSKLK